MPLALTVDIFSTVRGRLLFYKVASSLLKFEDTPPFLCYHITTIQSYLCIVLKFRHLHSAAAVIIACMELFD